MTEKETDDLPESDKLVLSSLSNGVFHQREYKKLVKKEALDSKYIKPNKHGKFIKIIKMLIIITLPIIFMGISYKLDNYAFNNYRFYEKDNGINYLKLTNRKHIEKLYYNNDIDINDYYYTTIEIDGEEEISYNYAYIRADRLKYPVVMFSRFLYLLAPISILVFILLCFISAFKLTEQIIYFNKEYYRTVEGKKLLNKAYALKNYLKDYSIMKYRSEDELILWEYYMVYAVVLDVNTKIENEVVEKYLQYISVY